MFERFIKKQSFLPKLTTKDFVVLAAGVSAYVALAMSTITKFSIWFDEAFGSYLIRFNYLELTRYTAYDVHPPLYYWLLKTWSLLFGNTELGIRSMSVFFGVVTIIALFLLACKLFGKKVAYVSLLFLVISPLFIRYGQEARMYTLLTAVAAVATYVFVYAQRTDKRWAWVTYGVFVAIGMLTQYFAALVWLAHWAWRASITCGSKKKFLRAFFTKNWIIAHVVAVGLFLPWLPWLIRQFADVQGNGFWIPAVSSMTMPDFFTNFLLFSDYKGTKSWLAAGFLLVFATLIGLAIKLTSSLKGEEKQNYRLLTYMVIVPAILLFAMSLPPLRPAFIDRYLLVSISFLPLLMGVSFVLASRLYSLKILAVPFVVCIAMMGYGISQQMLLGNYNKSTGQSNNVRQIVEKVRADDPSAKIVARTPWVFYEAVIYTSEKSPIYFVDRSSKYEFGSLRMLKENDDFKIKDLDAFTRQNKSFWVISNLRDSAPAKMQDSWQIAKTIIVNDDVSGKPLFQAIHVTAE